MTRIASATLALVLVTHASFGQQVHPTAIPLGLSVPFTPTPVLAEGRRHLLYELHLTNYGAAEITLRRLDVLDLKGSEVASYDEDSLQANTARPGTPGLADKRVIAAGLSAVVFVDVAIAADMPFPEGLRHRVTTNAVSRPNEPVQSVVEGAAIEVSRARPAALGAPLAGSGWVASHALSNSSSHRRTLLAVDGSARIAQRFAVDWTRIGDDGQVFHGDPSKNTNWAPYGSPVLAIANARVVEIQDGIPENDPTSASRAVPINLQTVGGNYLILDLLDGRFAFYAHLQPGSILVSKGAMVRRGQPIAKLGNSGQSDAPHLHLHITNAPSPLGAEGLPLVLDDFVVRGHLPSLKVLADGTGWHASEPASHRVAEMPLENAVIDFATTRAAPDVNSPDFSALDTLIDREMRETSTPGAQMVVVMGGRVVYAKSYGVTSVETAQPVTDTTLFRIASTTKMLTAAAILVEAERLNLDLSVSAGRIAKGLPAHFSVPSLHQLLTHTGGMSDGASYFGPHDDDALALAVQSWPARNRFTQPGDIFSYSNLGYDLAARIVEIAAKDTYAGIMRRALFAPLGMHSSTVRPLEAVTRPFSQGHDIDSAGVPRVVRPFADDSRYWANGGVFTTATEFSRFLRALLDNGQLDGRRVLSATVDAAMLRGYVDVPGTRITEHAQYGYGFNVKTLRGYRTLQHGGERIGFGSVVRIIPEAQMGIVILTNRTGSFLPKTLEAATALTVPARPDSSPAAMAFASLPPRAGRYVNMPDSLEFDVVAKAGGSFELRGVGASTGDEMKKLPDGRYVAGGQPLVFAAGVNGREYYLHTAGRALRLTKSAKRGEPGDTSSTSVRMITDEADAVMAILAKRRSGRAVGEPDWEGLFATEGYRNLRTRELGMGRPFTDSAFRAFVLSDSLLPRYEALERSLAAYRSIDIARNAKRALAYLPDKATIHARLYLEIKPRTNSFVYPVAEGRAIFLYVNPAVSRERAERDIVTHELHHIGFAESCAASKDTIGPRHIAREYSGALGEGLAMLAAAGDANVDPHRYSEPAARERWHADLPNWRVDLPKVEQFLLDIAEGRLTASDSMTARAAPFWGDAQGAWYTVGYMVGVTIERAHGRAALRRVMCDRSSMLAEYNVIARGARLPTWSDRLIELLR